MNEAQLRQLLDRLAEAPAPPSTFGVAEALRAGRRRLRWRRFKVVAGSVIAICAAVAITIPVLGAFRQPVGAADHHRRHRPPPTAPSSLNPLVPYASFGWLPAGMVMTQRYGSPKFSRTDFSTDPVNPDLSFEVMSAGTCSIAGSAKYLYRTRPGGPNVMGLASRTLGCAQLMVSVRPARWPIIGAAPSIGGKPAYWLAGDASGVTENDSLAWQYEPGGWAVLTKILAQSQDSHTFGTPQAGYLSPAIKAQLERVAAGVRLGGTRPTPFRFQLVKFPAGWRVDLVTEYKNDPLAPSSTITFVPVRTPPSVQVSLLAEPNQPACDTSRFTRSVRLGPGVTGLLSTVPNSNNPGAYEQFLCVNDRSGLQVRIYVNVNNPAGPESSWPSASLFGGAVAVYHDLRIRPGGTTHPAG